MTFELVSIHGGHSGQFCSHARDSLEQVVQAYIRKGFSWVGITEHMPPVDDRFLYPEERAAGLNAASMADRFERYFVEARRLQAAYAGQIDLLIGFEAEAYAGAAEAARQWIDAQRPDYVLGGVHHVDSIAFDYSADEFRLAVDAVGGIEPLYCRYFDQQLALIEAIGPRVIAHFDLIRLFDPAYPDRWRRPEIEKRIRRNLGEIASRGIILDYNVAALRKGAQEPYLSRPLLEQALDMGISVVPGDDAHSADMAGTFVADGIDILKAAGCDGHWRKPSD